MKTKSKTSKSKPENKPMLVAFLLDHSGSMGVCKHETVSGFNSYIREMAKNDDGNSRFTLTQFDTTGIDVVHDAVRIDVVHDAVPIKKVTGLNEKTYEPRGGTPLYDAIGKTVAATEKKAGDKYKVLFVTLTDGEENSSSVFKLEDIQNLIKQKENKDHWTFAHIGVGMNGWNAARTYSHGTQSVNNILHTEHVDQIKTFRSFAGSNLRYSANVGASGQSVSGFWNDATQPQGKAKGTVKKK